MFSCVFTSFQVLQFSPPSRNGPKGSNAENNVKKMKLYIGTFKYLYLNCMSTKLPVHDRTAVLTLTAAQYLNNIFCCSSHLKIERTHTDTGSRWKLLRERHWPWLKSNLGLSLCEATVFDNHSVYSAALKLVELMCTVFFDSRPFWSYIIYFA